MIKLKIIFNLLDAHGLVVNLFEGSIFVCINRTLIANRLGEATEILLSLALRNLKRALVLDSSLS